MVMEIREKIYTIIYEWIFTWKNIDIDNKENLTLCPY